MKSMVVSFASRTSWNGPHRRGASSPRMSASWPAEAAASVARAIVWFSCTGMGAVSHRQQDRAAVAEEPLVHGETGLGPFDLTAVGLAPQLPGDLADLGERLRRHRLAEAGQAAARVHRHPTPDGGVAVVQQLLGLAG